MIENKVEYNGEEDDATRAAQLQKSGSLTPNTDITNNSICNSSTSASRNINNNRNNGGTETVTNKETYLGINQ